MSTVDLRLGDCLELMRDIPAGSVDAVITDPPYDKEAHTPMRRTRATIEGRSTDVSMPFEQISKTLRESFVRESIRVSRGWILSFCQAESVGRYQELFNSAWRRAMVWIKPDSAPQFSGDRPAMGYESIVSAWGGNGKSKWNGGGKRGVFTCNSTGYVHEHPTQKPIPLMTELIALFTNEGDTVLDPFMGSGTTGVACVKLGRNFIGMEISEQYFKIAQKRIADAQAQLTMDITP